MVIRNPKDFWAGLMFMAFGLAFVVIAEGTPGFINELFGYKLIPGYQMGTALRMGPAYFPVLLGGMLAVLGAIVFLRSFASAIIRRYAKTLGSAFFGRIFRLLIGEREPPGAAAGIKLPFGVVDLAVAVGVFVAMAYLVKLINYVGPSFFEKWSALSHDWAMLGSALVISVLAVVFRPETKAITLILASSLAFAYLLKPLGLALASIVLIFISAFGGHEFKWKEVAILSLVLVVFSVVVFVKGLTLPFPICPSFIERCPIT